MTKEEGVWIEPNDDKIAADKVSLLEQKGRLEAAIRFLRKEIRKVTPPEPRLASDDGVLSVFRFELSKNRNCSKSEMVLMLKTVEKIQKSLDDYKLGKIAKVESNL